MLPGQLGSVASQPVAGVRHIFVLCEITVKASRTVRVYET